MLVMRLKRVGRKNDPSFRIVVMDKRQSAKAGRAVESLGFYNPRQKAMNLEEERAKYWLSVGAKPSDTVHNILVSKGIYGGPKRDVSAKSKKKEVEQGRTAAAEQTPGTENKTKEKKEETSAPEPERKEE